MQPSDRRPKWLFDAVQAIGAAREFVGDTPLDAYERSLLLRSAVERQLDILGEASARLLKAEPTWAERWPALRLAVGLRNRIIHGCDAVDDETVWRTVVEDLSDLEVQLQQALDTWNAPPP